MCSSSSSTELCLGTGMGIWLPSSWQCSGGTRDEAAPRKGSRAQPCQHCSSSDTGCTRPSNDSAVERWGLTPSEEKRYFRASSTGGSEQPGGKNKSEPSAREAGAAGIVWVPLSQSLQRHPCATSGTWWVCGPDLWEVAEPLATLQVLGGRSLQSPRQRGCHEQCADPRHIFRRHLLWPPRNSL